MKHLFPAKSWLFFTSLLLAFSVILSSCDKDDDDVIVPPPPPPIPVVKPDQVFFALSGTSQLLRFNANASETAQATLSITGLQAGERILSIDFRPATGELYGLGSTSRLYVINTTTAAARAIGTIAFSPALSGASAEIDFNPTVDRLRVVGIDGQNLRLNPETGLVVATDGAINGVTGASINGVAYTGNFAGSTATVLYDIDVTTNKLYKQLPPNDGTLVSVGDLGVDPTGVGAFDINPTGSIALAVLNVAGTNGLFQIDTLTGKATRLGGFPAGATLNGIAIATNPVAYATDASNNLLILNPMSATAPVIAKVLAVPAGENVVGIDFRPVNGQLYALTSASRLYTVNLSSGAVAAVGAAGAFTLAGASFGFDFNPTVDRIRVISNTGQNLRLNPNDGTLAATDGSLNPGTPDVSAAAYTNNFAGATTTALLVIDATTDIVYTQIPPNAGTLVPVGPLGVNITSANGFDIGSTSNLAFGLFTVGTTTSLYSVNLTTGAAAKAFDFAQAVRGFAIGTGF